MVEAGDTGEAYLSARRVRISVAVVAVGFVLALVLGSAGLLGGGKALGSSTTLTVIGGDVQVRHGASGQFVAAVDGELLQAGDAIQTASESRAVLTFFEGSTVTIEPGSQLQIDAATFQGSSTIVQMTQSVGRTWHVVTKLVTGDSKYEVRTPTSTASVRGTQFTVDDDANGTTITTTEGTVLDKVPDPQNPQQTIDVPVTAGQQHQQSKNAPPAPLNPAPAPDRKVTISLDDDNSIVIDTAGRANGIDRNGKVVLQTPGATLTRVDGHLVITLPNIPDGRLQALTRKSGGDVTVETTVEDKGKDKQTSSSTIDANGNSNGQAHANVDIGSNSSSAGGNGNGNGNSNGNSNDQSNGNSQGEKGKNESPTPAPTETATPQPTQASGGGGDGTTGTQQGGGNSGQGSSGQGNAGAGSGSQGGDSGNKGQQGQNNQRPTPTPNVVPSFNICQPTASNSCANPPPSGGPGNAGGGNPPGGGGSPGGNGGGSSGGGGSGGAGGGDGGSGGRGGQGGGQDKDKDTPPKK